MQVCMSERGGGFRLSEGRIWGVLQIRVINRFHVHSADSQLITGTYKRDPVFKAIGVNEKNKVKELFKK